MVLASHMLSVSALVVLDVVTMVYLL